MSCSGFTNEIVSSLLFTLSGRQDQFLWAGCSYRVLSELQLWPFLLLRPCTWEKWLLLILWDTAQPQPAWFQLKLDFLFCEPPFFCLIKVIHEPKTSDITHFLLIELEWHSQLKWKNYIWSKTVFWACRSWWKLKSIPGLASMDKQTAKTAFSLWNKPDPKITFNCLKPDLSAPPTQCQVEYLSLTGLTKWDPHSVGGICALSAEMGLSVSLSL